MGSGVNYSPTEKERQFVRYMSAAGVPQDRIAKCVGIAKNTLIKHFASELENACAELIGEAAGYLAKAIKGRITKEGITAAIFILKTRGRWRETDSDAVEPEKLPDLKTKVHIPQRLSGKATQAD